MEVGFQRNCGAVLVDRWVGVLLNNLVSSAALIM